MRLLQNDLISYCQCMDWKTNKKYKLNANKNEYWNRIIEIVNNENWEIERLAWGLSLREAYEYLRAFYRGMEYWKILNSNN